MEAKSSQLEAKSAQVAMAQEASETELRRQISELKSRLESATTGRNSESEMAQESMVKSQKLQTEVAGLQARIKALEEENGELREQAEMERHTTKSAVSFASLDSDHAVGVPKDRLMSDPDTVSHQSSDGGHDEEDNVSTPALSITIFFSDLLHISCQLDTSSNSLLLFFKALIGGSA